MADRRVSSLLALIASLGFVAPAAADPILVVRGESAERWAAIHDGPQTPSRSGTEQSRLAAFRQIDDALGAVWTDLGLLRPRAAIARLTRARQRAENNADLPQAGAWMAEIEAMTAIVAAQIEGASWQRLADQALGRMASLDPRRILRAAEAPPALIARAEAAVRAERAAPEASRSVRANVEGAVVYLDDERVGTLPLVVRARAGRHHVRIVAPNHRPFGRFIDFEPGRGRDLAVTLSLDPEVSRLRSIEAAESLQEARSRLVAGDELLWIETSDRRALVVRCTTLGCGPAERQEEPSWPIAAEPVPDPIGSADRDWLFAEPPPPPPPPKPWHRRWGVWVGIGTALVVGIAGTARAVQREPTRAFQTRIDFGDTR